MKDFRKKVISGVVLVTMATYTMPIFAFANEEAIYSKLKADGEKYKTIISTTIESEDGTENTQIETDKEWEVIEGLLSSLQEKVGDEIEEK